MNRDSVEDRNRKKKRKGELIHLIYATESKSKKSGTVGEKEPVWPPTAQDAENAGASLRHGRERDQKKEVRTTNEDSKGINYEEESLFFSM